MKSYAVLHEWNVICEVCREKIKSSEAVQRWDGLIVSKHHEGCWEERHPLDIPRPPVRDDEPLPFTRPDKQINFSITNELVETHLVATFTFFDEFKNNLAKGAINLSSDSFKWALSNTAPDAANDATFSDITEISAGNGYTSGGHTLDNVTWTETSAGSGTWRFSADDEVFTASGGSIGPFRYVILYDDTAANDELVGYLDFGSALTLPDASTFTINISASGIFELD